MNFQQQSNSVYSPSGEEQHKWRLVVDQRLLYWLHPILSEMSSHFNFPASSHIFHYEKHASNYQANRSILLNLLRLNTVHWGWSHFKAKLYLTLWDLVALRSFKTWFYTLLDSEYLKWHFMLLNVHYHFLHL